MKKSTRIFSIILLVVGVSFVFSLPLHSDETVGEIGGICKDENGQDKCVQEICVDGGWNCVISLPYTAPKCGYLASCY